MCLSNLKQFLSEESRSERRFRDRFRGKDGSLFVSERRRSAGGSRRWAKVEEPNRDLERINQLRLQHLQMLTGAESSCVLFQDADSVKPLFWYDSTEPERVALAESVRLGLLPEGWESVSEREGEFAIVLCLKRALRNDLKAVKANLVHWFAAQRFARR